MDKKNFSLDKGPLDWFLEWSEDDGESRLSSLARVVVTQPFEAAIFLDEITAKLKTIRYPQPEPKSRMGIDKRTFFEILEYAEVLALLVQEDVLRKLFQVRLLKDLFDKDSELEQKDLAPDRKPFAEHKKEVRKIQKDLSTLERISKEYGLEEELSKAIEHVARACIRAWRPIITMRYRGSKAEVILGRTSQESRTVLRSEHTAVQALIFRKLQKTLQTRVTKNRGISDIFLCQLSELIWAPPDQKVLSSGETIQRAAKRLSL